MASRAPEQLASQSTQPLTPVTPVTPTLDEPSKYLTPTLASITESLALLGVSPETLAISLGETLAERYLASLRPKPIERPSFGSCSIPRRTQGPEPSLQLFSNDFIDYLNQIA